MLALHRFGPEPRSLTTELVCPGCATKYEAILASCTDARALAAFTLEVLDGFERIYLARHGDKPPIPDCLPEFLNG